MGGAVAKGRIGEAQDGFKEGSLKKKKKRMKRLEKESVERGDGRHSIEKSDEGKDKVNLG